MSLVGRSLLVTDAETRHGLAVIRSLGRAGAKVTALSARPDALGFASRYCASCLCGPAPTQDQAYGAYLRSVVRAHGIDALIAVGLDSCRVVAQSQETLSPHVALAIAPWPAMQTFLDKRATLELARTLGLPIPATAQPHSAKEAAQISRHMGETVVVKGPYGGGSRFVAFARSGVDAGAKWAKMVARDASLAQNPPMIQQVIAGSGVGFFGLYDRGRLLRRFGHERRREFPPEGGPSTCADARPDAQATALGDRLLAAACFHGVGMVEFRRSHRTGVLYLMEVNPKFWGSLDLAIAAGVDFPADLARLALGEVLPPQGPIARRRVSWLPGDARAAVAERGLRGLVTLALDLLSPRTRTNLSVRDFAPTWRQLARTQGA